MTRQTLVIGSTVVDVLLTVPRLPRRGEDVNITTSAYRIGGCAYNVFQMLRLLQAPALLCSPVGSGVYGRMAREQLASQDIDPFVSLEAENGCCYCLIEEDGERSFLSHHGAEYIFHKSWMDKIDYSQTNSVFICGLEVEEPTGSEIVEFVYEHPALELYFAPGPRIMHIPQGRMEKLLARRSAKGFGPVLHLNEREACGYTGKDTVESAANVLSERTLNSLVITKGVQGCYYRERAAAPIRQGVFVPGVPAQVVDTVGAGDAHCGALIAGLEQGMSLQAACERANALGAAVVGVRGAVLEKLPG
jgi:sugar/nucleoside kinase (ribokinase family)